MHKLQEAYVAKIQEAQNQTTKYQCPLCREPIEELVAIERRMMCSTCNQHLEPVREENKLSEEDQAKCKAAIEGMIKELRKFDDFVVPANFFGEGAMNAYVSLSAN